MAKSTTRGLGNLFSGSIVLHEEDFEKVKTNMPKNRVEEKKPVEQEVEKEVKEVKTDKPKVKPSKKTKGVEKKDKKNQEKSRVLDYEILRAMVDDDFKNAIIDYCLDNSISEDELVTKCCDRILERQTISKERVADKISGKTKSVYARCDSEYKITFLKFCKKQSKSMGYIISQEIADVIGYKK